MATLVFSTVGTMLGGPLGGTLGALIGQSIDQQLLGPATRGPRLGDLSVQTSSYGTQVPRIYGTMRVGGSVIWATDLVESSATTGAKGQPDTMYSYSVSLAVALSSRKAVGVRRIWADGKLLRGEEGDFKISTTFRFYDGSEDQQIDPLIGSIEGLTNTPAYRGLTIAVFENLELAEFGNRIPFLSFEVIADEEPSAISAILSDVSRGVVIGDAAQTIAGYAGYGQSIKAAIDPIVDCYGVRLFDDGSRLRAPPSAASIHVDDDELGNSADNDKALRMHREQASPRALPAALRLSYYDPVRDYQAGDARASAVDQGGNEVQRELPAVVEAANAKSLVQQMLARGWAERDKLTLRLAPHYLDLKPGTQLDLALSPSRWIVERCTIDAFVVVAELHPAWGPAAPITAEGGRIVPNIDIVAGQLTLAFFDVPDVLEQSASRPTLLLAASSVGPGWKSRLVEIEAGGQRFTIQIPRRKSVLGRASTALPPGDPYLINSEAVVEVELIDTDQWLTSCDDEALASGSNLAALGSELLQFGEVVPLGNGRFRLGRLLRARAGTEWAMETHGAGELFVLVEPDALRPIVLPHWTIGSAVTASCPTPDSASVARTSVVLSSESLRPPSPINMRAVAQVNGDLAVSWTRRSREGGAWVDDVDAPLGEVRELYRVTLNGSASSMEFETEQPAFVIAASDLNAAGTGSALIKVRQIGDWAASHPAQISLTLD